MVYAATRRLAPCLALLGVMALVGCDEGPEDSGDESGDELEALDQQDDQDALDAADAVQGPRVLATLELAYDGERLTATTLAGGIDGFRGLQLGDAELVVDIVGATHPSTGLLHISAEFTNITAGTDYTNIVFVQNAGQTTAGVTSTLPVVTSNWDAGTVNGEYLFAVAHPGGSFQYFVDVFADVVQAPAAVYSWGFVDTLNDDIGTNDLRDFFNSFPTPAATDWMFFEITSSNVNKQGAWCSTRADWFVNQYLTRFGGSGVIASGAWAKYVRNYDSAAWEDAANKVLTNYYGWNCYGTKGSWCSEWGIGNTEKEYMSVEPGQTGGYEAYNQSDPWLKETLTIQVGPDRLSTCGF